MQARALTQAPDRHKHHFFNPVMGEKRGAEVDCVVDLGSHVIPIEIKSSSFVAQSEVKGLRSFLNDYGGITTHGYVVTMGDKKEVLSANITAIPWFYL